MYALSLQNHNWMTVTLDDFCNVITNFPGLCFHSRVLPISPAPAMNLELLGRWNGSTCILDVITHRCGLFRVLRAELSGRVRRILGLHLPRSDLHLQQVWHPAGGGLQRWPHRDLGHPDQGHSEDNIGPRSSGLQYELVQGWPQGL